MSLLRIASDWHLSPRSPPLHGRLAAGFLRRAREDGASVILNGDVFDDLFEGPDRCRRAHPEVAAAIEELRAQGRLRRTCGNHDPQAGQDRILVDWPGVGRVLVAHGHAVDPIHGSWLGRLGDGISARFGRLGLVRGGAALAEAVATGLLGPRIVRVFRGRCLAMVEREGCALGVFGHVHAPHLAAGDRYANSGALAGDGLHFLELGPESPRLLTLRPEELQAAGPGRR